MKLQSSHGAVIRN